MSQLRDRYFQDEFDLDANPEARPKARDASSA
jgi:hypothetical protein